MTRDGALALKRPQGSSVIGLPLIEISEKPIEPGENFTIRRSTFPKSGVRLSLGRGHNRRFARTLLNRRIDASMGASAVAVAAAIPGS